MHGLAGGTSTGVEVERFFSLVQVQNLFEITMTVEKTTAQKHVGFLTRQFLESRNQFSRQGRAAELGHQLVIIDTNFNTINNFTFNIPRSDQLFMIRSTSAIAFV